MLERSGFEHDERPEGRARWISTLEARLGILELKYRSEDGLEDNASIEQRCILWIAEALRVTKETEEYNTFQRARMGLAPY